MSLICNTGRPPKDDALQNLTVNDTLRVNNLVKAAKAEINTLCARDQDIPLVLGGSLTYTNDNNTSPTLNLFALPSGSTTRTSSSNVAFALSDLWYTSQELSNIKFQVAAVSTLATTLNVSVGVTSNPAVLPANVLTVALPLTANTIGLVTDISNSVVIPAGSFVTVNVSSSGVSVTDVRVTWTLAGNP